MFLIIFFCSAFAELPSKVNLRVPFICQAPTGNWGQPYQDACEEGVIVMAMRYVNGKGLNKDEAHQEILALIDFQKKHYGDYHSTTAAQTAQLIKDFYKYDKVMVTSEVSLENIKQELAKGNLILAPMAGRQIGNPYYTRPGPLYHMLLIKGYDDNLQEFIVNDDGTRRGADYHYKYSTILTAIQDWMSARKVIIILQTRVKS